MIGIVRVATLDDSEALNSHGRTLEQRYGVRTRSRCIPDQPDGVHDAVTHAESESKIVAAARALVDDGAAGILISCAADPALDATRAAVPVPVVGAGSAAAVVAAGLGGRVGVLGITDTVPDAMSRVLGSDVAHRRPKGVRSTVDLLEPAAQKHAMDAARTLAVEVEIVVFACTGYVTIAFGDRVKAEVGVPVVDPVLAGGLLLTYALDGMAVPSLRRSQIPSRGGTDRAGACA
jgi:allantoin racemase